MTSKKTLYLANPYGFPLQQRAGPLKEIVADLEALGAEVWEPVARNNQIDRARPGWAYEIGQADLRDVRQAEGLFAVMNGCPPDEGVMVEGPCVREGRCTVIRSPSHGGSDRSLRHDIEGSGDSADGLSLNSMRWRARMR